MIVAQMAEKIHGNLGPGITVSDEETLSKNPERPNMIRLVS
jgi:hypothetical protein